MASIRVNLGIVLSKPHLIFPTFLLLKIKDQVLVEKGGVVN
jgi:hypothetical protein